MYKEQVSLPNKLHFSDGSKPNEKVLTIEPFYRGYGTTVGNALRRVLLSSLTGAAITQVKIKGVDHEFSTVENVKEDVVDIILNLKQVRFVSHSDEPVTLSLKVKGQKAITAKDFDKNTDVEVVNPDAHIMTTGSDKANIEMEVVVERGRGYKPLETNEDEKEIGAIGVDAIFTPVVNVSMDVSPARVGQDINFDKVTLTIETDGTITPEEAVERSAKLLVDHFSLFLQDGLDSQTADEEAEEETDEE